MFQDMEKAKGSIWLNCRTEFGAALAEYSESDKQTAIAILAVASLDLTIEQFELSVAFWHQEAPGPLQLAVHLAGLA